MKADQRLLFNQLMTLRDRERMDAAEQMRPDDEAAITATDATNDKTGEWQPLIFTHGLTVLPSVTRN